MRFLLVLTLLNFCFTANVQAASFFEICRYSFRLLSGSPDPISYRHPSFEEVNTRIQELVNIGPNRWAQWSNSPLRGKYYFQRGLSGGIMGRERVDGVTEAQNFFQGEYDHQKRNIHVLKGPEDTDVSLVEAYAMPLTIKGRIDRRLPDDSTIYTQETALLGPGVRASTTEQIALLIPTNPWVFLRWVHNYRKFMRVMKGSRGVMPEINSRGYQFEQDINAFFSTLSPEVAAAAADIESYNWSTLPTLSDSVRTKIEQISNQYR